MRNVIRGGCGLVLVCACGARSEIAGTGLGESLDASLDTTMSDVVIHGDGSPLGGPDAGMDATSDACTAISIGIGCGNVKTCESCKFNIEWKCGDVDYRVGGACDPPDVGAPPYGYEGVCDQDGKQTSTFNLPTTTCDCKDASALLTIVQNQCTHQ